MPESDQSLPECCRISHGDGERKPPASHLLLIVVVLLLLLFILLLRFPASTLRVGGKKKKPFLFSALGERIKDVERPTDEESTPAPFFTTKCTRAEGGGPRSSFYWLPPPQHPCRVFSRPPIPACLPHMSTLPPSHPNPRRHGDGSTCCRQEEEEEEWESF